MKRSKLLILPLVAISLYSPMQAMISLEKADIDKQAALIETKVTRDRYMVYGLTAFGVAHELYQWTPFISGLLGTSVEAPKPEKESMYQAFKAGMRSLFYTQEGWVSMVQFGLSIGGFVMISKMGEKFAHPDTSYWYVNTYAPYKRTIMLMQERLVMLQDPQLDQMTILAHKEFLHTLSERLVRQGKLICGYMTYKTKHLDIEEKAIARRAVNCMVKSQNDWLSRINAQLHMENQNYGDISKMLAAYSADITAQLNYFSVVEGESPYDRSVINRQIKMDTASRESKQ